MEKNNTGFKRLKNNLKEKNSRVGPTPSGPRPGKIQRHKKMNKNKKWKKRAKWAKWAKKEKKEKKKNIQKIRKANPNSNQEGHFPTLCGGAGWFPPLGGVRFSFSCCVVLPFLMRCSSSRKMTPIHATSSNLSSVLGPAWVLDLRSERRKLSQKNASVLPSCNVLKRAMSCAVGLSQAESPTHEPRLVVEAPTYIQLAPTVSTSTPHWTPMRGSIWQRLVHVRGRDREGQHWHALDQLMHGMSKNRHQTRFDVIHDMMSFSTAQWGDVKFRSCLCSVGTASRSPPLRWRWASHGQQKHPQNIVPLAALAEVAPLSRLFSSRAQLLSTYDWWRITHDIDTRLRLGSAACVFDIRAFQEPATAAVSAVGRTAPFPPDVDHGASNLPARPDSRRSPGLRDVSICRRAQYTLQASCMAPSPAHQPQDLAVTRMPRSPPDCPRMTAWSHRNFWRHVLPATSPRAPRGTPCCEWRPRVVHHWHLPDSLDLLARLLVLTACGAGVVIHWWRHLRLFAKRFIDPVGESTCCRWNPTQPANSRRPCQGPPSTSTNHR